MDTSITKNGIMKTLKFYLLSVIIAVIHLETPAQSIAKRALFIGNSYTYVNNLPQMAADLATSAGDNLIFDSHAIGGYKLIQHATDITTLNKIMVGNWDYVVLQEQSQTPYSSATNFPNGVFALYDLIKQYNFCAEPILYQTWGYKNGDVANCLSIPSVCTYTGMTARLKSEYTSMASSKRIKLSPVGSVWKYMADNYPTINLHQSDNSHPTIEGTYIAACCFYTSFFNKSPLNITNDYGLSATNTSIIRNEVKVILFDSLSNYDFNTPPVADFNFWIQNSASNQVVFNNNSIAADTYFWNFGDGSTSTTTLTSVAHTFSVNETYSVSLTVTNCNSQG